MNNINDENKMIIIHDLMLVIPFTSAHANEIYNCGARVQLDDHGYYYHRWSSLPDVHETKLSSHDSDGFLQYRWDTDALHLLFGQTKDQGTWFQLESHGLNGYSCWFHCFACGLSKLFQKQIGPSGSSYHTESHPLFIQTQK